MVSVPVCRQDYKWNPSVPELNLPKYDFNETNMIKFESEFLKYLKSKANFVGAIFDEINFEELMTSNLLMNVFLWMIIYY